MTEDHAGDEPNIGLLCFIVYRAMEARVLADLAAAGFGDVTAAQGRVFARIDPDGTRVTDLAERALITKQTAATWAAPSGPTVRTWRSPSDWRRRTRATPTGSATCRSARTTWATC